MIYYIFLVSLSILKEKRDILPAKCRDNVTKYYRRGEIMERLNRKIDKFLVEWKSNPNRLPLIIKGARQIGKTNAIRYFGYNNYKCFIEINFALNQEFKSIFDYHLMLMR